MDIRSALRGLPILELIVLCILGAIYFIIWRGAPVPAEVTDARLQLIGYSLFYALSGTMAAASIILSGTFIGLQSATTLPVETKTHIRHAVGWSLVTIIVGAWALALLPSR